VAVAPQLRTVVQLITTNYVDKEGLDPDQTSDEGRETVKWK
jgi:hypothetical protein